MISGYSKHKIIDFDAYNSQALSRIQEELNRLETPDLSLSAYTFATPDTDPEYCWAREEDIFTSIMTPEELATVFSKEEAIMQGMFIVEEV